MSDDEALLRAVCACPEDATPRLVYADWLEERGDPRAEYLRLSVRFAALPGDSAEGAIIRRQMVELRPGLPPAWLTALGDYRSTGTDPDPARIEEAAAALRRPARFRDGTGFDREIVAAAIHPLTGAVAYVDCHSQQRGQYLDINFYLRTRDRGGRETIRPIESYNPYFGCRVGFLEWYGDVAVAIYREKHHTYACRFGLDSAAVFKVIEDDWAVDGHHLGYRGYRETSVRRLAVPSVEELPTLPESEATAWGLLLPRAR